MYWKNNTCCSLTENFSSDILTEPAAYSKGKQGHSPKKTAEFWNTPQFLFLEELKQEGSWVEEPMFFFVVSLHGTAWACQNNYTLSIFYHYGLISWASNLETAEPQSKLNFLRKNYSSGFPMVLSIFSESAVCKATGKRKDEYSIWTHFLLKLWRKQGENLGAKQIKRCES